MNNEIFRQEKGHTLKLILFGELAGLKRSKLVLKHTGRSSAADARGQTILRLFSLKLQLRNHAPGFEELWECSLWYLGCEA